MTLAARFLPDRLAIPLFGDRKRHGSVPDTSDADWLSWQEHYINFYNSTQKQGAGSRVNDAGYSVLNDIDFTGLHVGEIGPSSLPHRSFWNGLPDKFVAIDIYQRFIDMSKEKAGCPFNGVIVAPDQRTLPLPDESIDLLLSFYSLEHLFPLGDYLDDYARVLKPGGRIVGAIPNEGGFAWGLGRFLTSRRWIHANTDIDYDKIICWEHPNFVDTIIDELDKRFERKSLSLYPSIVFFSRNLSLVTRFYYEKR